jgi:hypothetical protein
LWHRNDGFGGSVGCCRGWPNDNNCPIVPD